MSSVISVRTVRMSGFALYALLLGAGATALEGMLSSISKQPITASHLSLHLKGSGITEGTITSTV